MATIFLAAARSHSKRTLKRMRGFNPAAAAAAPVVPPTLPTLPVLPIKVAPSGHLFPAEGASTASLPFAVSRTASSELPVYTDIRHGGTKVFTVLRRYSGDAAALTAELRAVLHGATVEPKLGRIDITGNHVDPVKRWLAGLGF